MDGEGDWKCPECPYNSRNKTQLEKHIKTIAHTGINVKSFGTCHKVRKLDLTLLKPSLFESVPNF